MPRLSRACLSSSMRNLSPEVSCRRFQILPQICQPFRPGLHLLVRMAKTAADAILFLGMGGAQPGQPDQLGVHLGFFDDERIAGSDGFDLGIGQRGGVHVFEAAHGHVPAHHLGDELGLGFQRLPHIGIERAFGDVAINLHAGISIALPQNASLALLHVGGSPRRIQMMQAQSAVPGHSCRNPFSACCRTAHEPCPRGRNGTTPASRCRRRNPE